MGDFKRPKDCFRALRISHRLLSGGLTAGLAGCAAGVAACVAGAGRPSHVLAALLIAGGFAAMLAGWSFGLRSVVCPHCGAPLYEFPPTALGASRPMSRLRGEDRSAAGMNGERRGYTYIY